MQLAIRALETGLYLLLASHTTLWTEETEEREHWRGLPLSCYTLT